jgi:hypothetical protein
MPELLQTSPMRSPRTGLFSGRLVRELSLVAAIKLVLLFALWFAFFRQPDVSPPGAHEVSAALLGTGNLPSNSSPAAEPASDKGDSPW